MDTRQQVGAEMYALCARLFPMLRSITGAGVRKTLALLHDYIPLEMHEVPSGTEVFDWTVPAEWNVDDAYVRHEDGEEIASLNKHTLHLVGYSEPVRASMTLDELQPHLHSLPDHPTWIPYRTSYYARSWGFCISHHRRETLRAGRYEVVINSRLEAGSLTYGEFVVPGERPEEILISTHICHPSLANDNLSGMVVAVFLARQLALEKNRRQFSHRFVFIPGTIGSITWLARNEARLSNIVGGVVLSGVGDRGPFTYKRSRQGHSAVDRIFERTLSTYGAANRCLPFEPYGYDERQYCSPGIDLAVGCLMRTPFGQYPEYHTSADNLDFIHADSLAKTLSLCTDVLRDIDLVRTFRNLSPKCEPQLGRRGLYDTLGGESDKKTAQMALLWLLSCSDGTRSTLDISDLSGLPLPILSSAASRLRDAGLLAVQ